MKYILIVSILSVFLPLNAMACRCSEVTILQKMDKSDYVYFGRITEATLRNDDSVENKLKIIETVKGKPDSNILLSYAREHNMCSMYAATGLTYIVYGKYKETPKLTLCSKSHVLLEGLDEQMAKIRDAANQ
ncbi:hypothetical protein [Shewanella chilikensis]|uniref:hypothetical protein n=1 Tax=Shewanella chilikensis TaxID=558541 RepID=UPI00399B7E64